MSEFRFAALTDQFGVLVGLVHVMRDGAEVVEELAKHVPAALLAHDVRAEEFVEKVTVDEVPFEYLYSDGDGHHFMNTENYEQLQLQDDIVGETKDYLVPNLSVKIEYYDEKPIGVLVPDTVDLTVVETEQSIQKATASAVMKAAKLETGLVVNVPPFVNTGDKIKVDTSEARYIQRVQ